LFSKIFWMAAVEYDLGRSRAENLNEPCVLAQQKAETLTSTKSTIPDELSSHTKRPRHTKEDSVELHLVHAVVSQQHTRVSVNIRPWVLGLASLQQDIRNKVVDLADELEHLVFRQVLQCEFTLGSVTRVGLAEDGVTVSRNDLATLERRPDVLLDSLVGGLLAKLGLHLLEPDQDLLVGQSVEGTGETVESSRVGEEGIGEGRTDEFTGVGGDVTAFVVGVDGDVETHEFDEGGVFAEAEEGGQVGRVVLGGIDGGKLAGAKDVAVDAAGNVGQLSDEVHGILKGGSPVLLLGHTLLIGLGESRVVVELERIE
jgi:hypothetical protein